MSNTLDSYVIREAQPGDAPALIRLAGLDSAKPLEGRVLVGETGGRMRAAIAITNDRVIADPFHRTAELRSLLEARAAQIRRASRRHRRVAMRTVPTGRRAAA